MRQYNAVLSRLQELGTVSEALFSRLEDDASFDEVGIAAMQLQEFLQDEEDDRPRMRGGIFEATPGHVKIVDFPGNIGEIGNLVRDYLPDFIKQRMPHGKEGEAGEAGATPSAESNGSTATAEAPPAPEPPPAPAATTPEPPAAPPPPSSPWDVDPLEGVARQLEAVGLEIRSVSAEMSNANASPEQVQALAAKLNRLIERQSDLLRQHAELSSEAV
ncbi:MAG: hypothetical protein ACK47B_16765 [Armatimonadota bacterium]